MKFYQLFDSRYLQPIPKYEKELNCWQNVLIKDCLEDLVSLNDISNKIIIEPKYFLEGLAGTSNECRVRVSIRDKLVRISKKLPDGYFLKIWDGFRTNETQQALFDKYYDVFAKTTNLSGCNLLEYTQKFVSLPSCDKNSPSPHNTGAAIDLTICDRFGKSIELGTDFDNFDLKSYTRYYEDLIENNVSLTELEMEILFNRRVFYNLFKEEGFFNYPYEIWHKSYKDQMWCEFFNLDFSLYGSAEI